MEKGGRFEGKWKGRDVQHVVVDIGAFQDGKEESV